MKHWSARVEWTGPAPADEQWAELAELLEPHSGQVGLEGNGRPSAQLHIQADTLAQATAQAISAVEAACKALGLDCAPTSVEALPWEDFQEGQDAHALPELVGHTGLAEILGVARQRAATVAQTFPDRLPVATTVDGRPVYLRSTAEAFNSTWDRKRTGRPRKTQSDSA